MKILILLSFLSLGFSEKALSYSANKVWFEFMENGQYKVFVNYTVPPLKEFRESYVIFNKKREAERFFWAMVRGADFYPSQPVRTEYSKPKLEPDPW